MIACEWPWSDDPALELAIAVWAANGSKRVRLEALASLYEQAPDVFAEALACVSAGHVDGLVDALSERAGRPIERDADPFENGRRA